MIKESSKNLGNKYTKQATINVMKMKHTEGRKPKKDK